MQECVVIYRVSTEGQVERGNGLLQQQQSVHDFAETHGLKIVREFTDAGVSGSAPITSRPGLVGALQALEPGMILLCSKLDRIARDMLLQLMVEQEVKKKRCRILSASNEGTGGDAPTDILMRQMMQVFSNFERNLISSRTKASLQARKRAGLRTGTIPYGYYADSQGRLLKDPKTQQTISLVKTLRSEGYSWRRLADELNNRGILNRKNRTWNHHNLRVCCRDK